MHMMLVYWLSVDLQVTSYGGKLTYTVYSESSYGGTAIEPGPDVVIHVCLVLTANSNMPSVHM